MNSANSGENREMNEPTKTNSSNKIGEEYEVTLKIVGKHNVRHILKYSQDLMAEDRIRHENEPMEETFNKCHEEIASLIRQQVE